MKKSTKKLIISLIIIIIMGLSSIAYVATGIFGSENQQKSGELTSAIVKGEVASGTESTYVQRGYTWIKYYPNNADENFTAFIESLPQVYFTASGQIQIIVQELSDVNSSDTVVISSLNGQQSLSDKANITQSLCTLLYSPPIECLLSNNSTNSNATA